MYKPSIYNQDTKQQIWMSIFADSHDQFCCCDTPFAHALTCMFPEGHKDRQLTIQQIINRDTAQCHSGGTEETNHGLADFTREEETPIEQKEDALEDLDDVGIEELIAAADAATER